LRVAGMPCNSIEAAVTWHATHVRPSPNRRPKVEPSADDMLRPGTVDKLLPLVGKRSGPTQTEPSTYQSARAAREVFTARLAALEYEQSIGRLVNANQVRSEYGRQVVQVRDQFLRLPDRLAPMLVGLRDMETIKRVITAEVQMALTNFRGRDDGTPPP